MAISGISSSIAPLIQSSGDIKKQLDDLQRQLGSGLKADTFSGLGSQSGVAVSLSAQLSALSSYDATMTNIGGTLTLQQTVLQQIASVAGTVQTATAQPNFSIDGTGQTTTQKTAASQLDQMLSLLNTQGGNGYLFSGSGLNEPSVDTADHILNGNGTAAGLKTLLDERLAADQGNGLGRLVIPAVAGSTVAIDEDVAGSPFGLKLAAINTTSSNAIVSGPPASPGAISVNLGATNPNDGDTFTFTFTLPDKTTQTLQLQATSSGSPGTNQFSIGASPAATAANLQAALSTGVSQIVSTSLVSASAMAASNNFFDHPPQRVNGALATATSLVDGTSANTVFWYTGDNSSGSVRSSATARIDQATTVSYGTQANEEGIRWLIQNVATLAATKYAANDPNASANYSDLNQRINTALGIPVGTQNITDIEASLANVQTTITSTQGQHQQTTNVLTNMLQSIEGIDQNQIGVQILALQTSLSASLSTTARLSQMSLLNYLSPVSG